MSEEIDSAFNLTNTYRRDSDITRRFGDIEAVIQSDRFDDRTGELLLSDEDYFAYLMKNKFRYGHEFNAAWMVSNCNLTSGARRRFEYGQSLIDAGLKLGLLVFSNR